MSTAIRTAAVSIFVLAASAAVVHGRELTFPDRVVAQEAIERVYYSHQIGAEKPFEEAVPRQLLERKVVRYLKQSAALGEFWHTPVTAEMLERELQRMSRGTRIPDRLRELFAALDDDPVLIQETLARAALVDRLSRNFYAFDSRFHTASRQEWEALRESLTNGNVDPWQDHPRRTELELILESKDHMPKGPRHSLSAELFDRWRSRLSDAPGEIRFVEEDRDAFHVRVLLEGEDARLRVAAYRVEKMPWDIWWQAVSPALDETAVIAVATTDERLANEIGRPDRGWDPDGLEVSGVPCLEDDSWDNGSLDDMTDPRRDHTAVWTGSLMLVWGGGNPLSSVWTNHGGRYDPATDSWTPTSTAQVPSPRGSHSAVWTGNRMLVWGGNSGSGPLNTGGRYDPAADTWTPTSTVDAPSPRGLHTAVWTGGQMLVWGGAGGSGVLNTGGRYDPTADSWTATSNGHVPPAREGHTAVWTGGQMLVWGGDNGSSVLNTGGRYDPAADSWMAISTDGAPAPRDSHTAIWTGDLLLVWGGESDAGYLSTGGRYDPATDSWAATSPVGTPWSRRDHTAVWTGSRMVVWGGFGCCGFGQRLDTGGSYDPTTDTWTATSLVGTPERRDLHTAIWTGSQMVVWGGSGWNFKLLNSGGRYDPASDSWTATSIGNAPLPRTSHTAVWTGSLMVVWGGYDGGYMNTGGRYDPATDSWTATSTAGAPSTRSRHTAVWTGSRMVVWGGYYYGGPEGYFWDTGGRYDPVADSWTATSTAGAPLPRAVHTAIWTGSLMLVWGGFGGEIPSIDYLSTGGVYDPATDIWTETSTAGAPEPRDFHTAIWTGSLMLVWGGWDGDESLEAGGRYDPATDSWTPISTAGAPLPRSSHTAVWTGDLMLVWGGYGGSSYLDSGGRYEPTTDNWTPTSTAGAPSPRTGHTAVWTGSEMLVWGGRDSDFFFDTGGRSDPLSDSWTPISTAGAPSPRAHHTAVWTGSLMLVWGGQYGGSYGSLNTGGRYALGYSVDDDGDGYTECAGDCNDGNPSIFPGAPELCDGLDNDCNFTIDEEAEPPEIAGLTFESESTFSWQPGPPGLGAIHDIARGLLDELPVGSGAAEICLVSEPSNSTTDLDPPAAGAGYWYLVRGRNDCGIGTYGQQSDTTERVTAVCP